MEEATYRDPDFVSNDWELPPMPFTQVYSSDVLAVRFPKFGAFGFTLTLVGRFMPTLTRAGRWPAIVFRSGKDPEDAPGAVVQLWRRVVRCEGTSATLTALWHPDRGERIVIHGLEDVQTDPQAQRSGILLREGSRLLRKLQGSRRGAPALEESTDAGWYVIADQAEQRRVDLRRRNAPGSDWLSIATYYGVKDATLKRWRRKRRALVRDMKVS
jgi:hypothetical protein